jgi:hypothetical protein
MTLDREIIGFAAGRSEPSNLPPQTRLRLDPFDVPAALELIDNLPRERVNERIRVLRYISRVDPWQHSAGSDLALALASAGYERKSVKAARIAFERGTADSRVLRILVESCLASGDISGALKISRVAADSAEDCMEKNSLRLLAAEEVVARFGDETLISIGRELAGTDPLELRSLVDRLAATSSATHGIAAFIFAFGPVVADLASRADDRDRRCLIAWTRSSTATRVGNPWFDVDYAYGRFCYELELFDDCEKIFRDKEKRSGPCSDSRYFIGACREVSRDFSEAMRCYRDALWYDPHCSLSRAGVARMKEHRLVAEAKTF